MLPITYSAVLKDVWTHIRQPTDRRHQVHAFYAPDEYWFRAVWDPIVDAAAESRRTARTEEDKKNTNITAAEAEAIATPTYNHYCIYTFLALDSGVYTRRARHLIPHRM